LPQLNQLNSDGGNSKKAGVMEPKIKYSVYDLRRVSVSNSIERSEKAKKEEET
jgi:hypothetical protein